MRYGERQGIRAPGDWRLVDLLGLGLASSAGIITALITDFQVKGEASALFTINKWAVGLAELLGYQNIVPLWAVALGLVVLGAGSVFYFKPITRQGAFAQGAGLLAFITTAIPADFARGLQEMDGAALAPEEASIQEVMAAPQIIPAAFAPTSAVSPIPVQYEQATAKYDVYLTVNYPEGLRDDIDTLIRRGDMRGRLHNEDTGETWNLFRTAGGTVTRQGNSLIIRTGVAAQAPTSTLWVRIETTGYTIEQQSKTATLGQPLRWTIDMRPSSTPLFLQRLNTTYRF